MTQTLNHAPKPPKVAEQPLPGLHRAPLTETQRLEAVRRLQDQAEQRIKIGLDLFKAAEQHTTQHRKLLKELQEERFELYEKMQQEMTQSFNQYDQWVGQLEENIATSIDRLETRIEILEAGWEQSQVQVQQMIERSEAMANESKQLLEQLEQRVIAATKALREQKTTGKAQPQPAAELDEQPVNETPSRPVQALTAGKLPASTPGAVRSLERQPFNEGHRPATPTVTPAAAIDLQSMLAASRRRRASTKAATIEEVASDSRAITATLSVPDEEQDPQAPAMEQMVIELPTSSAAAIIGNLNPPAAAEAPQAVADGMQAVSDDPCMLPPAFEAEGHSPDQAELLRAVADQVNRAAEVLSDTASTLEPTVTQPTAEAKPAVVDKLQNEADSTPAEEKYMPPTASKPADPDELKTFFIDILERLREKDA